MSLDRSDSSAGFTETWLPLSQEETNRSDLQQKAHEAMAANRTFLQKTNAQMDAAAIREQMKALTRQANGILRLLLNDLGGTD